MKKFNNETVKITNKQAVRLNGKKTLLFDVFQLKTGSWIFMGRAEGKTYQEAYDNHVISL